MTYMQISWRAVKVYQRLGYAWHTYYLDDKDPLWVYSVSNDGSDQFAVLAFLQTFDVLPRHGAGRVLLSSDFAEEHLRAGQVTDAGRAVLALMHIAVTSPDISGIPLTLRTTIENVVAEAHAGSKTPPESAT